MSNKFMKIGEVAKLLNTSVSSIRYYSDLNLVKPRLITEGNYRMYADEEIWKLQLILSFRQIGFSLDEVKSILTGNVTIKDAVIAQCNAIERQIEHLAKIHSLLKLVDQNGVNDELALISSIGKELTLNEEDRNNMIIQSLEKIMISCDTPSEWIGEFMATHKKSLKGIKTRRQFQGIFELEALIQDKGFIDAMKVNEVPLWYMFNGEDSKLSSCDQIYFGELINKLKYVYEEKLEYGHEDVISMVRKFIEFISNSIKKPLSKEFITEFVYYTDNLLSSQNKRYWEAMSKINPEIDVPSYPIIEFMVESVNYYVNNIWRNTYER